MCLQNTMSPGSFVTVTIRISSNNSYPRETVESLRVSVRLLPYIVKKFIRKIELLDQLLGLRYAQIVYSAYEDQDQVED
jgi:hypothetical protein